MTEEMVEHTFKKYCAVNVVILKVYPTTSAKHKMWHLWNAKTAAEILHVELQKRILIL